MDALIVLVILGLVLPIGVTAFRHDRAHALIFACQGQLSDVGKAMLSYAGDYDGALPAAGGRGTKWGPKLNNWSAATRSQAFGLDTNQTGGEATISASLYLLVRHNGVSPESFVCGADKGVTEFRPQKYGVIDRGLADLWDFSANPARHCSYAYQMVYGPYLLATSGESSTAIAADRNPWIDSPFAKAGDFSKFVPGLSPFEGTREQEHQGNAIMHGRRGQNVLFLDGHVEYAMCPYCGYGDDNIYTSWKGKDKIRGTPPKLGSQPANRRDSLLVNDPSVPRR